MWVCFAQYRCLRHWTKHTTKRQTVSCLPQLSGGRTLIPRVGMNDVAVFVSPGDFLVAELNTFQVVMLLSGRILDVVHKRSDSDQLDVIKRDVEVLHFLTGIVDAVKLKFCRFQGLSGGHSFVEIRAGRIDFFGKRKRLVSTGTGQFAGVIVGRDVHIVIQRHHFDATFAPLNVHGTFDIRAAVIFQPEISRNSHENYSPC
ncbi:Hypothetical protein c3390 [Escherichia coli CFT073]|uniref:Uncharacterized protein n=1 Tax=Escherichia coli O6:H1 (strain CFT073 / ATCC 700928 / UPEC) TaxID=199310 RepID=A0A0H2VAC8_ECOL6|nr:Hypothetical protein c3390 [Escherichia coli CFT073]